MFYPHSPSPYQFGRWCSTDFVSLGLTRDQLNRLVDGLLTRGFPIGRLLSPPPYADHDDDWATRRSRSSQAGCSTSNVPSPSSKGHFKAFRKLFGLPKSAARQSGFQPLNFTPTSQHQPSSRSPEPTTSSSSNRSTPPPLSSLIAEQSIRLHDQLGAGSFGIVRRADWTTPGGRVLPVAVKLLRREVMQGEQFKTFLDELRVMHCLSHPNLIQLYGIVLSDPIMMVTELAPLGNLLQHLRAQASRCRDASRSNTTNALPIVLRSLQADSLWDICRQLADGMAYLVSHSLVHRDLAARNVLLVSSSSNTYSVARSSAAPLVKIGDFGLVQRIDDTLTRSNDKPPSKPIAHAWSAPESIQNRLFTQATDVWSWAVACWETWTYGAQPWPNLSPTRLLVDKLSKGKRLAWPKQSCPRAFYQLMLACWRLDPSTRPSFTYLTRRLGEIRPLVVTAGQSFDEADRLGVEIGDRIVLIDHHPAAFWWRGQNRRSGEFGLFPREIVRSGQEVTASAPVTGMSSTKAASSNPPTKRWSKLSAPTPTPSSTRRPFDQQRRLDRRSPSTATYSSFSLISDYQQSDSAYDDDDLYSTTSGSIWTAADTENDTGDAFSSRCPKLDEYDRDTYGCVVDERQIMDEVATGDALIGNCRSRRPEDDARKSSTDPSSEKETISSKAAASSFLLPPPPGPSDYGTYSDHYSLLYSSPPLASGDSTPIGQEQSPRSTPPPTASTKRPTSPLIDLTRNSMPPWLEQLFAHQLTVNASAPSSNKGKTASTFTLYPNPATPRMVTPSAPIYSCQVPNPSFCSSSTTSQQPAWIRQPLSTNNPSQFSNRPVSFHPLLAPLLDPTSSSTTTSPSRNRPEWVEFDRQSTAADPLINPFDASTNLRRFNSTNTLTCPAVVVSSSSRPPPLIEHEQMCQSAIPDHPVGSCDKQADKLQPSQSAQQKSFVNLEQSLKQPTSIKIPLLATSSGMTQQAPSDSHASENVLQSFSDPTEIDLVCRQLPGLSRDEASLALTAISHPSFLTQAHLLDSPPIPSAPTYSPLSPTPSHRRVGLAVRLVRANHLASLQLTSDWRAAVNALSSANWSLDWAAEQLLSAKSTSRAQ